MPTKKSTKKSVNLRTGRLPDVHVPTAPRKRGGPGKPSRFKEPKKKPCRTTEIRSIKRGLRTEAINDEARDKFITLLEDGLTYRRAMRVSGISQVEAAQLVDKVLSANRGGATAFLLAEEHLIESMKCLSELMKEDRDSKVRLMAAAKLSDTSYKILNNQKFIERSKREAEACLEKVRQAKNTWDTEFEINDDDDEEEKDVREDNDRDSIFSNSLFDESDS
jgi:hypothetical protein